MINPYAEIEKIWDEFLASGDRPATNRDVLDEQHISCAISCLNLSADTLERFAAWLALGLVFSRKKNVSAQFENDV